MRVDDRTTFMLLDDLHAIADELERRLRLTEEEIRLREHSQIPVIPRAAQAKMERLEAALKEIAKSGPVFDAKGTWSKRVCEIARSALGESTR